MIKTEIRSCVHVLRTQGDGLREIGRLLNLARNTVRRVLREPRPEAQAGRAVLPRIDVRLLEYVAPALARARGNAVRAQQLLAENGLDVPYSSLTRWIRQAELRQPPRRAGEYHFAPAQRCSTTLRRNA